MCTLDNICGREHGRKDYQSTRKDIYNTAKYQ